MNRDLYRLIKGLKKLSVQDLARVQEFINQLRAADLRELRAELKAVAPQIDGIAPESAHPGAEARADADVQAQAHPDAGTDTHTVEAANDDAVRLAGETANLAGPRVTDPSPFWRRRAFQDIAADDLRPIAALYREAKASRAIARQRFGAN